MERLTEMAKDVPSIPASQISAGTTNGSLGGASGWIDTAGFDAAKVLLTFGAADDTLSSIYLKVFESDVATGGGTQISGAQTVELSGASCDNKQYAIDLRLGGRANKKRYIRPQIVSGPIGVALLAVTVELYAARVQPVAQTNAAVIL